MENELNFYKGICEEQTKKLGELQEENNKWEYWASEVVYWSHTESLKILEHKELITEDDKPKPTILKVRDFGKELSKLKEENKKLKEENDKYKLEREALLMKITSLNKKL